MRTLAVISLGLALVVGAGCNKDTRAPANGGGASVGTAGRTDGSISNGDKDFVRDVAEMNMAEVELGRLATEHASGPDVKQFAQMVVTDHTAAGDKLRAFATQRNIDLPAELDGKHRDLRDKLTAKTGLDFDRDFADAMVDDHQKLVDKLETRIDKDTIAKVKVDNKNAPDAQVKATAVSPEKSDDPNTQALNQWAADTYPTAYAHLQAAKALRDGVKKRATN